MLILEVVTKQDKKEFIDLPKRLYKNDPCWVCPLDSAVESVFDPTRNHTYKHGKAIRWILKDDVGLTIGRIAAFIDSVRSSANYQPTGGIGFFEVIESREAAFILFDKSKLWLRDHRMEAIDGPINFGENDNNWGLLVSGFIQPGFGMPYNMRYYRSFFEEYGFKTYFEQYSYHKTLRGNNNEMVQFPERIMKIANWLEKRPGYSFHHFERRNKEKYIKDIVEIYNSAWSVFKEDFTPLKTEFLYESFEKAKTIIDEELIWFAYHNDRPISFFVLLPDVNQILINLDGKMHLWNMIRFLYYKLTHKMTRMRAVAGGVHPSYQNSGVESAIFFHLHNTFMNKPWFRELELSWTGDFNPKMIAIFEALGASRAKTHITFRYLLNDNLLFRTCKEEMIERENPK